MTEVKWKIEHNLCRCCHAEGSFRNLGATWIDDCGQEEVYSLMLRNQLGLVLSKVEGLMLDVTYTICDACIHRLREVGDFKRQVLACEQKFHDMYIRNMFTVGEPFQIKEEKEESYITITIDDDEPQVPTDNKQHSNYISDNSVNNDDDTMDKAQISDTEEQPTGNQKPKGKITRAMKLQMDTSRPKVSRKKKKKHSIKPQTKMDVKNKKIPILYCEEDDRHPGTRRDNEPSAENDKYACKICGKQHTRLMSLHIHLHAAHKRQLKSSANQLQNIKYYITDNGSTFNCSICHKKDEKRNVIIDHYRIHFKGVCLECETDFETGPKYRQHLLEEHGIDQSHKCRACDATFTCIIGLRNHMNSFHRLGRKKKCDKCDYETYGTSAFRSHKISHMDVKRYRCRFCKKAFQHKRGMNLHENIHTKENLKMCNVCNTGFVQRTSLKFHMQKHHPDVLFV